MTKQSVDVLKFLVFEMISAPKALTMALNVQKIKEVVEYQSLSAVPDGCESLIGIYNLRGTPIPIFNILQTISRPSTLSPPWHRILICDLQSVLIGFPVTKTGRTLSCQSAAFLPPPRGGLLAGRKMITGVIRREDHYVPVLDLDSILDLIDPDLMSDESKMGPSALHAPAATYLGKRVLVVEDSKVISKKLVQVFSEMGFTVETAENGEDGLKLCRVGKPFDLVFTDIEMPLLDGISMIRTLKSQPEYSQVPVLFNSALSNPALISDIENEKLGRYIVKYDKNLIVAEVNAALRSNGAR